MTTLMNRLVPTVFREHYPRSYVERSVKIDARDGQQSGNETRLFLKVAPAFAALTETWPAATLMMYPIPSAAVIVEVE